MASSGTAKGTSDAGTSIAKTSSAVHILAAPGLHLDDRPDVAAYPGQDHLRLILDGSVRGQHTRGSWVCRRDEPPDLSTARDQRRPGQAIPESVHLRSGMRVIRIVDVLCSPCRARGV